MTDPASWDQAATGWKRQARHFAEASAPVAHALVDALKLQPGERVLDLAAGLGETGFLAAEVIAPGGRLICSDSSERMLEGARERADELGIDNVDFKLINGEWIDLELASVDALLCRWGFMMMDDPAAALRECRRVLAPGGRLALAVWARREANPWHTLFDDELSRFGPVPTRPQALSGFTPGTFALGDSGELEELIAGAGFVDVQVQTLDFRQRYDDAEDYIDVRLDLSGLAAHAFAALNDEQVSELERRVSEALAPFTSDDGAILLGSSTLIATASA